jgi:lysylphosphatidylglycerol synthetase-like protein (DUF2156 family)
MNFRIIAIVISCIAFLLALYNILSIPSYAWQYVTATEASVLISNICVIVSGLFIAWWIYHDYEEIQKRWKDNKVASDRINTLEERLKKFEEENKKA